MSLTIARHASLQRAVKTLPHKFVPLASELKAAGPVVLVVFSDKVVTSGKVRKAFRKIETTREDAVLLVGREFTSEARECIAERKASLLSETPFGWTDSSYEIVRIDLGSSVKTPDWEHR